jgi:excinuclease ABC subunit A
LKSISLDLPLHSLITLTGVSGSGKSTIAKDIIYAEGQRRYLDCLSPYARQFIKELKKPAIDDIQNVQPTICVYQHTFQPSALSTVATMSEVYNFLRLLFAKIGVQFCPDHPEQSVSPLSAEQIASYIKGNYEGSVRLLAPVINQKKGHHKAVFQRALETEISEVRVDGTFSAPGRFIEEGVAKTKAHSVEFVTARCTVKNLSADLLTEGVKQALSIGGGTVIVHDGRGDRVFSSQRTCQVCQRGFFKPDPEDLSFNSRRGRCPRCDGYGVIKHKSCPECGGSRLHEIGRNIKLFGHSIDHLAALSAPALLARLKPLSDDVSVREIAQPIVHELEGKLRTLTALGLDHLELRRECSTLSNGELQRLRLATAIGSPLTGVTYIFDEPSAGLHPADNRRLLDTLTGLRDRGNTVIQIEHEIDNILHADEIIEVGPGAGTRGGEIVFQGSVSELRTHTQSNTARALTEPLVFSSETTRQTPKLTIRNATRNNLRSISCEVPLQSLVTVAGVSGAGKSSLVHGVLVEALEGADPTKSVYKTAHGEVRTELPIERLLVVDQQPIGKTSRSTPASYLGIWDDVRGVFASTLEAKSRGWGPSFFSHNTGKGRCPVCKGNGELTLEMSFLAEAKVPCESCGGTRFTLEADSIRYRGLSVSQVLALTFEEARTTFVNHRKIHQMCAITCELGLGYLTLGQPSSTLSGGESQRLKLASELHQARRGHTLYILDEPTTGLHRLDVALLLKALHGLVALGHSVVVIEHDADTLAQSDWVLEVGPGPGAAGGTIVYSGTPRKLQSAATPWGIALRERIALHEQIVKAA